MVKGYEFAKDQYVMFSAEELKALEDTTSHAIDIGQFVPLESVDPLYFDGTYYLAPDKGGAKPYTLLATALRKSKQCAVGRWISRGKEHIVVIRPIEDGLALVQAQAMACGVPVIATKHTGSEDLFSNGVEGFVVPIRDAEAIAGKIRLLHDQPDLQKEMSQAALQRVKHLGGWDAYGNRITEVYRNALQEREENKGRVAADHVVEMPLSRRAPSPDLARRAPRLQAPSRRLVRCACS